MLVLMSEGEPISMLLVDAIRQAHSEVVRYGGQRKRTKSARII
jgi:hypothetical protein